MPWGAKQYVDILNQNIGTLEAQKINLAAPLRNVAGTVNVRLANPLRLSAGSVGAAVGAGIGINAGGSVVPRLANPLRVSSGSVGAAVGAGIGINAGGSIVPRLANPLRVSSGSVGAAVGAGIGLNAGGSIVPRLGAGLTLSNGTIITTAGGAVGTINASQLKTQTVVGGGVGVTAGTLQVRLANPLRLSSGTTGVRVGAGLGLNAGGSIVARLDTGLRLASGSIGIGSVGSVKMALDSVNSYRRDMSEFGPSLLLSDFDNPTFDTKPTFGTAATGGGSCYIPPGASLIRLAKYAAGGTQFIQGNDRWNATQWRRLDVEWRGSANETAANSVGAAVTGGFSDRRYNVARTGSAVAGIAWNDTGAAGTNKVIAYARTYSEAIQSATLNLGHRTVHTWRVQMGTTNVVVFMDGVSQNTFSAGLPGTRLMNLHFQNTPTVGGTQTMSIDYIHVRGRRLGF